jgi:hypothetical protein
MALTGHLSDLSLSELIEFFCNQRKTGLLTVQYPRGSGSFFLQNGSVVDARIGTLRGIDAVYYALTLPNAAFEFKAAAEAAERTINQPWTQVVLEGLRRLDEGIEPTDAFANSPVPAPAEQSASAAIGESKESKDSPAAPAFLSFIASDSLRHRKPLVVALAVGAVLVCVAAIGVPAGWYGRSKTVVAAAQPHNSAPPVAQPAEVKSSTAEPSQPATAEPDAKAAEAAQAAKRQKEQKEKERKARDEKANAATAAAQPAPDSKPGAKKVTVQVTFDESGRVVQASGADPTALRIARQKRFPAGKAGTATVTIPIN